MHIITFNTFGHYHNYCKIPLTGGADIDMRNGEGMTLLHQAILKGDEKTALYLVKQGSNFDAK